MAFPWPLPSYKTVREFTPYLFGGAAALIICYNIPSIASGRTVEALKELFHKPQVLEDLIKCVMGKLPSGHGEEIDNTLLGLLKAMEGTDLDLIDVLVDCLANQVQSLLNNGFFKAAGVATATTLGAMFGSRLALFGSYDLYKSRHQGSETEQERLLDGVGNDAATEENHRDGRAATGITIVVSSGGPPKRNKHG